MQVESINKLINEFSKLPGVGKKVAQKYAYFCIDGEVSDLVKAINEVKEKVKYCEVCGNFCESTPCRNCELATNKNQICIVAYPKDVLYAEKIKNFNGQFHVLHGTLSPLDGRGPNDIRIKELLKRINDSTEVIIATNTDVEGEATAMYISKILKPIGVKTTRLAQGISIGTDLEYADEITLNRAFERREEI